MRPIPFFSKRPDSRDVQDYLMAHADALIAGTLDRSALARRFPNVDPAQIERLMTLAEQISRALVDTAPSDEFIARLRHELLNSGIYDEDSLVERLLRMAPRTQLEWVSLGGATLTAGVVVLLASRPLLDMIGAWYDRRTAA